MNTNVLVSPGASSTAKQCDATGDQPLYDELVTRFDKDVVQGTASEFVTAKLAEREERHRRGGQSRYLVEPNVKDGKGGLRDLHTLFWIAKYVYRVRETDELVDRGVIDAQEYRTFRRCAPKFVPHFTG